jgi:hypothetical protein
MTTIVVIGALMIACAYLFKRMYDVRAENASLRVQVASLKRQLARMRG